MFINTFSNDFCDQNNTVIAEHSKHLESLEIYTEIEKKSPISYYPEILS